ncbi:MAG: phage portal protein [Planctomycetaceae bacterium]|nr:phage portal protein [Planctomycetaceae bacterium]
MNLKNSIRSFILKSLGINEMMAMIASEQQQADLDGPREKYKRIDIVFSCVEKIVNGIAGLPLVLSTEDENIVESGPVYDILFNNPNQSWQRFVSEWIGHWTLTRDVFIVFGQATGLDKTYLQVVSGLQMFPITDNGQLNGNLVGWEYRGAFGERRRFGLNEVHQTKNFNPYDRFHGTGPLYATSNATNFSHAVMERAFASLKNGCEPGIILVTPAGVKLDSSEKDYIAGNFDARHAGSLKTKRTAVLTGGMDVKTIAQSMVDLQASEIGEKADCKTAVAFGVAPQLLGLKVDAQYSHGPAQRDFVFGTLIPLAALFGGEITAAVGSRGYASEHKGQPYTKSKFYTGRSIDAPRCKAMYRAARQRAARDNAKIFAWFDVDQHPVVQEAKREWAKDTLAFTQYGLTLEKIVESYDLPFDVSDLPWAKEYWISPANMPARWVLQAGMDAIVGPKLPEGKPDAEDGKGLSDLDLKANEARRSRIWLKYIASFAGLEREMTQEIRVLFLRQQRELIAKLEAAWEESKSLDRQKANEQIIARVVFDLQKENGKLRVINRVSFEKGAKLGSLQTMTELGVSKQEAAAKVAHITDQPAVRRAIEMSSHKISKVNEVTQQRIADQLQEGLRKGEGLPDLTKRIEATLGENRARAQTIARTQTSGAVSTGRFEGLRASAGKKKSWLTARDGEVRPEHLQAEKTYADGIPVDQPFTVGGESLMYPCDPSGTAAMIANCRCLLLALFGAAKLTLEHYDVLEFVSYEESKVLFNEAA